MMNSKTVLERLYREISYPIADPDTYAIGYGFHFSEYKKWMQMEGFRTDSTRCATVRWIETWVDCGLLLRVKGDLANNNTFWFMKVNPPAKEYVGTVGNSKDLNNVYSKDGEYNPKMRVAKA